MDDIEILRESRETIGGHNPEEAGAAPVPATRKPVESDLFEGKELQVDHERREWWLE